MSIFQDKTTTIPKDGDGRVSRVPFDKLDIGGRKSQIARADKGKNDNSIQHIKSK